MTTCVNHADSDATHVVTAPSATKPYTAPILVCEACADRMRAIAPAWPNVRIDTESALEAVRLAEPSTTTVETP